MALRRNSIIAGIAATLACAGPALADMPDNYIYNYMGHSDSITIGLGDAPTSNLVIMHPTPWPSYINNTKIRTPSQQGINALDNMMGQYMPGGGRTVYSEDGAPPTNPGSPSGTPATSTAGAGSSAGAN